MSGQIGGLMSKIGRYNLALQEQANELGFSTVQEALEDDFSIVDGQLTYDAMKGLESAHRAWEKEKAEVLKDLAMVADNLPAGSDVQQAVEHAIKFVEGCHE